MWGFKKNSSKKLVTHNGSFHADDVFAAAVLSIYLEKRRETFEIIRTRDEEIIKTGDYVFDVGGIYDADKNRFDHHQKDGAGKRDNNIEYSSFGLVWKKFGIELCSSQKAVDTIDQKLAAPIDAFDNGVDLVENKYEISPYFVQHLIFAMRPTWRENLTDDKMFFKSATMAKEILSREIIQTQDVILAEESVIAIYKKTEDKRIIVLNKNYPYEYILHDFPEPLFVIYLRKNDNFWVVKTIQQDPKTFNSRKNFPSVWSGLCYEEFQKITGVSDAVFCHRGLFLAVAKSKEGAIKLAQLAL
ncbi:hypothetical protein A3B85_01335 [Candidatus Nomurabacteria bacterium RIFCSPHIGHO2_02_FULL_37_13]|uniref:Metal-dependent hydrolase n=1 Tax=Candidatus Nomurabacteria bacterium RIFCSPHIGHO2_02_FULL_37_13 TaxID=1801750 RepID=A0A1F6W6K3_9BACT|nr:MAG: hypothetical protein A2640_00465 [Candidatus Nomurabacteria bacterium RIFCSPHIGHO2_01_FULL_36_23]OGI77484.1 MAG: hypothetical protein A3B85_01335 [Candidatus Nomurabacteria bacterium RIFCSPHIGHO2_02_FULL_37_13]OGI87194.1 MAG: hypothetical protein A2906_02505 [Candidatus Nomurabacteria bacterium RIFCSPLOWO2_01_FULL_37_25]